ncbi:MAG: choice-of-anchor tandem repeat GloVer-containing protein [Terriglobales bacterium]
MLLSAKQGVVITIVLLVCGLSHLSFGQATDRQATETVLWSFGQDDDGAGPYGRLIFDASGNIFGTTAVGGTNCLPNGGCGTVFELSPSSNGWAETVLYDFCSATFCSDGAQPFAGLVFDNQGNLYGTTYEGGSIGAGTVFELSPPLSQGGQWTETVLWSFGTTKTDGAYPYLGALNWDTAGNLYGTTEHGGVNGLNGQGTVYELSPNSTGGWTETIIHSFDGQNGAFPAFGVAIDSAGNLYGTTVEGGSAGLGLVYRLSPTSTGKWKETVVYTFKGQNGANPYSPISFDAAGNLYGTFSAGGRGSCEHGACGGVFKLTPKTGGGVSESSFLFNGKDGGNPFSGVLLDDQTGTLFGQ